MPSNIPGSYLQPTLKPTSSLPDQQAPCSSSIPSNNPTENILREYNPVIVYSAKDMEEVIAKEKLTPPQAIYVIPPVE